MKRLLLFLILTQVAAWIDALAADSRDAPGVFDTPPPPSFLIGPVSVLLTNTDGFSAHVVMLSNKTEVVIGELSGRGNKLFFANDPSASVTKRSRTGGISFIWDVAANRGFMLDEALQGYAPVASSARITDVLVQAGGEKSARENIAGHRCEMAEAAVTSIDGSVAAFRLWRATDLKGFPVRITPATNSATFSLDLSRIRLVGVPGDVFLPPDGFTKYDSADAMMDELASRRLGVRRGASPGRGETEDFGGPSSRGDPGGR